MAAVIPCPHGEKELHLPDDFLGRNVRCPGCRETFHTPPATPSSESAPYATQPRYREVNEPLPPMRPHRDCALRDDDDNDYDVRHRPRRRKSSVGMVIGILVAVVSLVVVGVLVAFVIGWKSKSNMALASAQAKGDGAWQTYTSEDGRFKAMFPPGEVKVASTTAPTAVGDVTLHICMQELGPKDAIAVMYADYPPAVLAADSSAVLEGGVSGSTSQLPGSKIENKKVITLGPYPGREFEIQTPDNGRAHCRIYLVKQRLYTTMIFTSGKFTKEDNARFLDSFELIGK